MPALLIIVDSGDIDLATMRHRIDKSQNKRRFLGAIIGYLQSIRSRSHVAHLNVQICSAFAAGYVDCDESDSVDGTDEIVIAGTTLAVEAAPANESQFLAGASDTIFAANLATTVNAHSVLSKIVRAYSVVDRCHIVSKVPGPIGNLITLTEVGNGFTVSAAALASGAGDETDALQMGYLPTGLTA